MRDRLTKESLDPADESRRVVGGPSFPHQSEEEEFRRAADDERSRRWTKEMQQELQSMRQQLVHAEAQDADARRSIQRLEFNASELRFRLEGVERAGSEAPVASKARDELAAVRDMHLQNELLQQQLRSAEESHVAARSAAAALEECAASALKAQAAQLEAAQEEVRAQLRSHLRAEAAESRALAAEAQRELQAEAAARRLQRSREEDLEHALSALRGEMAAERRRLEGTERAEERLAKAEHLAQSELRTTQRRLLEEEGQAQGALDALQRRVAKDELSASASTPKAAAHAPVMPQGGLRSASRPRDEALALSTPSTQLPWHENLEEGRSSPSEARFPWTSTSSPFQPQQVAPPGPGRLPEEGWQDDLPPRSSQAWRSHGALQQVPPPLPSAPALSVGPGFQPSSLTQSVFDRSRPGPEVHPPWLPSVPSWSVGPGRQPSLPAQPSWPGAVHEGASPATEVRSDGSRKVAQDSLRDYLPSNIPQPPGAQRSFSEARQLQTLASTGEHPSTGVAYASPEDKMQVQAALQSIRKETERLWERLGERPQATSPSTPPGPRAPGPSTPAKRSLDRVEPWMGGGGGAEAGGKVLDNLCESLREAMDDHEDLEHLAKDVQADVLRILRRLGGGTMTTSDEANSRHGRQQGHRRASPLAAEPMQKQVAALEAEVHGLRARLAEATRKASAAGDAFDQSEEAKRREARLGSLVLELRKELKESREREEDLGARLREAAKEQRKLERALQESQRLGGDAKLPRCTDAELLRALASIRCIDKELYA